MRIHPNYRAALAVASLAVPAAFLPLTSSAQTPAASSPAPASASTPATPAPTPPTAAEQKDMFIALGWFIAQQADITALGLSPTEVDEFVTGMKAAIDDKELPVSKDVVKGTAMNDYLSGRAKDRIKAVAALQAAAADKFFADLDKDTTVKKTSSGLYYTIVTPGADTKAKSTDTATVKYKGTLIDGKVFDQTDGDTTAEMDLGSVIKGWSEGVELIGKGGKVKLYIPAKLAYGENPPPQLPPNATLIFDVELVDLKPTPPPAPSSTGDMSKSIQDLLGSPPPSGK